MVLSEAAPVPAERARDSNGAVTHLPDIRVREWAPCVHQAADRGEVPEGTDAREVIRAVSAPLYHRLLTTGDSLDEAAADQAAAAAARPGAYVRGGDGRE